MQKTRSVNPSFELTDDNASRVAETCHHLDEPPLAIKLAAARIQADNLLFEGLFAESLAGYKRAFETSLAIDDRISVGIELASTSLLTNVMQEYQISARYAEALFPSFK